MVPPKVRGCGCVASHSPTCRIVHRHHVHPLGMGGLDEAWNVVVVCPNTHAAAHQLIRLWGQRYDGPPPWWVVRHFSVLARELAEAGWRAWDEAGRPVDRERWVWQGAGAAIPSPQPATYRVAPALPGAGGARIERAHRAA